MPMSPYARARLKKRSFATTIVASRSPVGSPTCSSRSQVRCRTPPRTLSRPRRKICLANLFSIAVRRFTVRRSTLFDRAVWRWPRHDRHTLPPQPQGFPVNPGDHRHGHHGMAHERAANLVRGPGAPIEAERRCDERPTGIARLHVRAERLARRREAEDVLEIRLAEWRHLQRFLRAS